MIKVNSINILFSFIKRFFEQIDFLTKIRYKKVSNELGLIIHSSEDTVNKIINDNVSVSRFGDGEFYIMWNMYDSPFQERDKRLSEYLNNIISQPIENHIVCLPQYINSVRGLKRKPKIFWINWVVKYRSLLKETFKHANEINYYDTQFSRFYIDKQNIENSTKLIQNIRHIWNNRNVFIVEGESTRFGVGNDLLLNAADIKRILCPSKNAFEKYDKILFTILEKVPKHHLILIALGMTATVLSYELTKHGYQAIDIGHLDIEYEWFKRGEKEKAAVPHKAVNEIGYQSVDDNFEVENVAYLSSIVARI